MLIHENNSGLKKGKKDFQICINIFKILFNFFSNTFFFQSKLFFLNKHFLHPKMKNMLLLFSQTYIMFDLYVLNLETSAKCQTMIKLKKL